MKDARYEMLFFVESGKLSESDGRGQAVVAVTSFSHQTYCKTLRQVLFLNYYFFDDTVFWLRRDG